MLRWIRRVITAVVSHLAWFGLASMCGVALIAQVDR